MMVDGQIASDGQMSADGQRELERVRTVEERLERVEALPEPARGMAVALVQALLALYGEGLDRLMAAGRRAGGESFATDLVGDDLVEHLLLLHGLHPQETPERIARAIDRSIPRLHGARARLVEVAGGVARLRIGNIGGCGSSRATVEETLEQAVRAAAPEVSGVELEYEPRPPAVIPLDSLRRRVTLAGQPQP